MNNRGAIGAIAIVLIIVVIFGGFFVTTRNKLVNLEEDVNLKWAQVENQLKRRADLIPNLLETVKGYASHEKEVIQQIADARTGYTNANTPEEYAEAEVQLERAINNLNVIVENYPDLKASQNFENLQIELAGTENRISTERMRYNEAVSDFNRTIKRFPTNIIAGMANFSEKQYFEISEADKEVPEVKF